MIEIQDLAPGDRPALETLLAEIHQSAHGTARSAESFATVAREIAEDGFLATLIAWRGENPVGLAIYTFLHPTDGAGATLFLKELFVSERARGQGLGRNFMGRIATIAQERGCARIDWTTGKANTNAIGFYESLGVPIDTGRVYFRVAGDEIAALGARAEG